MERTLHTQPGTAAPRRLLWPFEAANELQCTREDVMAALFDGTLQGSTVPGRRGRMYMIAAESVAAHKPASNATPRDKASAPRRFLWTFEAANELQCTKEDVLAMLAADILKGFTVPGRQGRPMYIIHAESVMARKALSSARAVQEAGP